MLESCSGNYRERGIKLVNISRLWVVRSIALALLYVFSAGSVLAEDRWVTDQFEVMMRSEKGSGKRIVRQLKSGTKLEVVAVDSAEGYTQVKTGSGQAGWVLSRYLRSSPTAKLLLPAAQKNLQRSEEQRKELQKQRDQLRSEKQALERELANVQGSSRSLQDKVERITKLSSSTIQVDQQNQQLKQRIIDNEQRLELLEIDNARLASRSSREWFLVGSAVLIAGLLLGLILPRIRWKKKSSWSDF